MRDYLARNAHRRTVAPAAYELQQAWSVEPPLDWNSLPLMRQRSAMVASCSLRKPLLSRVATRFTFAMHNMDSPRFFACAHDRWGSTAGCLDPELWLVHLKGCFPQD